MNPQWIKRPMLWVLGGCAGLCACSTLSTSPERDQHFGQSVQQIRRLQTLNLQGVPLQDQQPGIDAAVAVHALDNYGKSFCSPRQAGSPLSGIGGK